MEAIREIPYIPMKTGKQPITPVGRTSQARTSEPPVNPRLEEVIELAEQQFREGKCVLCKTTEDMIAFLDSL
jgi:hypothetical protein